MAEAPGHKLGQLIGDSLEIAVEPLLRSFADRHRLFLDTAGPRPARNGTKVAWIDDLSNTHDLDFVLERGGTEDVIGTPAAFIESAWRRYTKHSRNKAQEMQGAVLPLLSKWSSVKPFAGAVIGGEWTEGAIQQLRSSGFQVLHISYIEMIGAFALVGIEVATDENTPDDFLQEQVDRFEALTPGQLQELGEAIRNCAPKEFEEFFAALETAVTRTVSSVVVLPLYGEEAEYPDIAAAVEGMSAFDERASVAEPIGFQRLEVLVRFTNGDRIEAEFGSVDRAVAFLRTFED